MRLEAGTGEPLVDHWDAPAASDRCRREPPTGTTITQSHVEVRHTVPDSGLFTASESYGLTS